MSHEDIKEQKNYFKDDLRKISVLVGFIANHFTLVYTRRNQYKENGDPYLEITFGKVIEKTGIILKPIFKIEGNISMVGDTLNAYADKILDNVF